ncbi:MAG: glycosyltransferase [Bacillota bacterium]
MINKRKQTIDFREFMGGSNGSVTELLTDATPKKFVSMGGGLFATMAPRAALAATADATFGNVWSAVMNIVDWIAVGVFVFAGVSWMFGHRGKALELIIGGAAGYILARHAIDIRDFLKGL